MKNYKYVAICVGLLMGLLPAAVRSSFPPQPAPDNSKSGKAAKFAPVTPAPKETPMPFHVGETLNYRVAWASFATAASLQVTVPEKREIFGWPTWHFRAALHTQSPVRSLFTIDDQFDSYADAHIFDTRRYETYQNELGRKENHELNFMTVGQKPWGRGPDVVVLPGTYDPVSALYALRGVDWQQTPEFRAPVYDGHDVYQLIAHLDAKSDMVSVAAGTFSTSRVGVKLLQKNSQTPEITFDVWLANNAARTPVQFQARLPFGSIRAELIPASK
ncbi:MAG TPA: DUF3108 domain-containing protein [Candidatus Acidoferrales bacterium]|jgi:hypothetical protein|nr:DUF3108 domain-containing protein [Candidatus Acidoferrales bacterium]